MLAMTPDNHSTDKISASALHDAIQSSALFLEYQPKINLNKAPFTAPDSLEALVRWRHDRLGVIQPDWFIPLAESNRELAYALTETVLRQAAANVHEWCQAGACDSVAVNVPAILVTDTDFPRRICEWIADFELEPSQLIIEVTETGHISNVESAMATLTYLCEKGFTLSLDDFGMGYSSLSQLYRMPFSELKIDRLFIKEVASSQEAQIIVRSTIDLAHDLGMTVCAEGVESADILKLLRSWNCDKAQGYYLGRPMLAEEMVQQLWQAADHAQERASLYQSTWLEEGRDVA